MILQELCHYYDRLAADPEAEIAAYGYSVQQVGFCVVIESDGTLFDIQQMSEDEKGRQRARKLVVPGQSKPPGAGINPCLLWDNATYLLGQSPEGRELEWAGLRFEAFRKRHLEIETKVDDDAFGAVCRFLKQWSPEVAAAREGLADVAKQFGVFQLRGKPGYVHERPRVKQYWNAQLQSDVASSSKGDDVVGQCLVTGEKSSLARLHDPPIKSVAGAQMAGAKLVSFNDDAYESYGKSQSFNAPVSQTAAFAYATAANKLLADRHRRVLIGDTTTVFWTDKPSPVELTWGPMLDSYQASEDEEQLKTISDLLKRIRQGEAPKQTLGDPSTQFFILGLAPNASRLSIRYWLTGSLEQLHARLREHLNDLWIVGLADDKRPPVVRELLAETAREIKDISPVMAGAVTRAILSGQRYPEAFFKAVLRRIGSDGEVNTRRAAILKAYINRFRRLDPNKKEAITVSLDSNKKETPYVLGRLFATYEKIQKDGMGEKLNRTVKDSYFSSASASPAAVFPRLCKLSQYHLNKIEFTGVRINREKLLGELYGSIESFPNHLSYQDQGLFAIGYYHQVQDFYTKKPPTNSEDTNNA